MTNNGNGYCQYLIDKEDHQGSTDEEMSNIHHLSPSSAACRAATLPTFETNVWRQLPTFVSNQVGDAVLWWSLLNEFGPVPVPRRVKPKIADRQPEKPRACRCFVGMPLYSTRRSEDCLIFMERSMAFGRYRTPLGRLLVSRSHRCAAKLRRPAVSTLFNRALVTHDTDGADDTNDRDRCAPEA
jgi:hypothetical protein